MIRTFAKQFLSTALSALMVTTSAPFEGGGQQTANAGSTAYSGEGAPLSASALQQLAAPIALYPDALVAQVLGSASFPDQVAAAGSWIQQNKNLTGPALMQAVDEQPWDPSVKALTQFPSVLDNLAKNLSWTSALGEAYSTQPADVMSAIQALRAQAKAAGNLKSGSQITVVQQSPQTIVIQPTNPQVVYVPQYNPTVVYGAPVQTPGYSSADVAAAGLLMFGVGIAVGAAINNNSCCGWSYSYWNCNWHGGTVVYNRNVYYGNNAWHGGYYGSSATAYGPNGSTTVSRGYNSSTGTYARGGTVSTPYGTQSAGQAYNPSTGSLCPWCVGVRCLWKRSGWSGIQPVYGSLWRHTSSLQRLRELRKLGCNKERPGRIHPTSNHRARVSGNGTDYDRGQRRCRDGREWQ